MAAKPKPKKMSSKQMKKTKGGAAAGLQIDINKTMEADALRMNSRDLGTSMTGRQPTLPPLPPNIKH